MKWYYELVVFSKVNYSGDMLLMLCSDMVVNVTLTSSVAINLLLATVIELAKKTKQSPFYSQPSQLALDPRHILHCDFTLMPGFIKKMHPPFLPLEIPDITASPPPRSKHDIRATRGDLMGVREPASSSCPGMLLPRRDAWSSGLSV